MILSALCLIGVEFGARMITIDGKQIKLQIWDTVSLFYVVFFNQLLKCNSLINYRRLEVC